MTEIWKPIARFDNIVEASNKGSVRTVERTVKNRFSVRIIKARQLKTRVHPWGYRWCEFMVHGVRYWDFVHRLVLEAFVGPCPDGYYVLHGDNNPRNNCLENLRYGTPTENCADKLIHGTQPTGEQIPWHKLKEDQIVEIRLRRASGEILASIAKDFGISEVYVWQICTGNKWTSAGGPIEGKIRRLNILDADQRAEVARLHDGGMGIRKLSKLFNTSITQIQNILRAHENKVSKAA